MKAFTLLVVALTIFSFTGNTYAGIWDGNKLKLFSDCNDRVQDRRATGPDDELQGGAFLGYITGIIDATYGVKVCPPKGVQVGQLTSIVKKYLYDHPEILNQTAYTLSMNALTAAFPCKTKNK